MSNRLSQVKRETIAKAACKDKFFDKYKEQFDVIQKKIEEYIRTNSKDKYFRKILSDDDLRFVDKITSWTFYLKNSIPKISAQIILDFNYSHKNSFTASFEKAIYGFDKFSNIEDEEIQAEINKLQTIFSDCSNTYYTLKSALSQVNTVKQLKEQLPWAEKYLPEDEKSLPISLETLDKANKLMENV